MAWLKALAARASKSVPGRVLLKFIADDGPNDAIVIAWNTLFAIFPIALALAAALGLALKQIGLQATAVTDLVVAIIPNDANAQGEALAALNGLQQRTGVLALVALIGFLWTAAGLFGAMERAFDKVFVCSPRNFLRQKAMALAMMAIFSVLALFAVGTSALLPLLKSLPFAPAPLRSGPEEVFIQVLVGVLSGFALFLVLYIVVPNRPLTPRQVWPGALLAGAAFEALGYLFPLYISLNKGINAYGRTFALLFVLMLFFYLVGVITVAGAELNAVLLGLRERGSSRLDPA